MSEDKSLLQSLCDLEIPTSIKLSPDGQSILYSTELTWGHHKGKHPVSTLWLASTNEANSSQQLTTGTFKDYAPAWSPNGESIAYISDRAKVGEKWAIYIQHLSLGNVTNPITDHENERAIEMFKFSPNGKQIAFLSADERTVEQKEREQNGEDVQVWGEELAYARLRIVDLDTEDVKSLGMDRHVTDVCWSPDGQQIGLVSCNSPFLEDRFLGGSTISTVDAGLTVVRDLCLVPMAYYTHLQWTDDGRLYFCAGVPIGSLNCGNGVYAIDPISQSPDFEKVAFGDEDDVDSLIKANGQLIAKVGHRLEHRISFLGGRVIWSQEKAIEAFDAISSNDGNEITLAFATSDVKNAVEVFSTTTGGGAVVQLSDHGQAFKSHQFGICTCSTNQDTLVAMDSSPNDERQSQEVNSFPSQYLGKSIKRSSSRKSSGLRRESLESQRSSINFTETMTTSLSQEQAAANARRKGKCYMQEKDRNNPQTLITANQHFLTALDILESLPDPDPAGMVRTLHLIMNVRVEMSYNRGLSAENRLSYLQEARDYSEDAFDCALKSPHPGDMLIVKLYQAILSGREVEVTAKKMTGEEARRRKKEAIEDISKALRELRRSGDPDTDRHYMWAEAWRSKFARTSKAAAT